MSLGNSILFKLIGVVVFFGLLTMCNSRAHAIHITGANRVGTAQQPIPFSDLAALKGEPLTADEMELMTSVMEQVDAIRNEPQQVAYMNWLGVEVIPIACGQLKISAPKVPGADLLRCWDIENNKTYMMEGAILGAQGYVGAGFQAGVYIAPRGMTSLESTYYFLNYTQEVLPLVQAGGQVSFGKGCIDAARDKTGKRLELFRSSCQIMISGHGGVSISGLITSAYKKFMGAGAAKADASQETKGWSAFFKKLSGLSGGAYLKVRDCSKTSCDNPINGYVELYNEHFGR